MASTFKLNRAGIAAAGRTTKMVAAMRAVAEAVASHAKNTAPVQEGDYRDGLEADASIEGGVATGKAKATDWKSGFIEFGTSDTPTFAPLRKAAESLGLRFKAGR